MPEYGTNEYYEKIYELEDRGFFENYNPNYLEESFEDDYEEEWEDEQ